MIVGYITERFLRRYFLTIPPEARIAKYHTLQGVKWIKGPLEKVKPEVIPDAEVVDDEDMARQQQVALPGVLASKPHYHQYRCVIGDPLNCRQPLETLQADPTAHACKSCRFLTTLPLEGQLVGKRGTYRIGKCLGKRGIGRLYEGVELSSEQPITIQEYVLPERYFNPEERRHRQDAFLNLAGLSLSDGRIQDLRLLLPTDAIATVGEARAYVITPAQDSLPTLNQTLYEQGALTSAEVKELLNQVLQTLSFLHQQKFLLPTGQVKNGIVHANLGLDSLIWRQEGKVALTHVTDFELWEKLFDPALVDLGLATVADDLADLGHVAFYALNGAAQDRFGKRLNPRLDNHWPESLSPELRSLILRLVGIETPFESADSARQALLKIPDDEVESAFSPEEEVLKKRAWWKPYAPFVAGAAVLAVLVGAGWWLWRNHRNAALAQEAPVPCCLAEISGVATGEFHYTSVGNSVWQRLIQVAETKGNLSPTLFSELAVAHPDLNLNYQPSDSVEVAIATLQALETDFAIVPLTQDLPEGLDATIIAYDGLVPFVAFNSTKRQQSLPTALQGKITVDQLTDLYLGRIENWQAFSRVDLPVTLYVPQDPVAVHIMEQRILGGDLFSDEAGIIQNNMIEFLPIPNMLRATIRDFEIQGVGSLGVAPLSSVFGQCSVYPLAVKVPGQKAIQTLMMSSGEAVTPKVDICDRKGSYEPNADFLRQGTYPLAYPIAVVYPLDNSRPDIGERFANLLLTVEGQTFLQDFGLVTAYELPEDPGE